MQKSMNAAVRRNLWWCLSVSGILAAVVIVPFFFRSSAGNAKQPQGLNRQTVSREGGLDNYDIRTDKAAFDKMAGFRQSANQTASAIADVRDEFVTGEKTLQNKVGNLKIEYSDNLRAPEVIAPAAELGKSFLTSASTQKRSEVLRNFAKSNENLLGVSVAEADTLEVAADYTNPNGDLSFTALDQKINGIPVFQGEIKAGFGKNGQIIRVINNLAPGLENAVVSDNFGDSASALRNAAAYINHNLTANELTESKAQTDNLTAVFGSGDYQNTTEKMYFPTEPGVARTAWRVLIWQPTNAYYVIVDAETGALLWRKNITADQTQAATYNIYYNANNLLKAAHNPAPLVSAPFDPVSGSQGTLIPRTDITLIGNESPNAFNNLGWLTDGANTTDGNNVQAGLDRDGTDGVDAAGVATGANRVFSYAYTPAPGTTTAGDEPLAGTQYQQGIVTNLFYITNRYHDEMYKLGFTEAARNFQTNNFSRGGVGNDRVSAEAQDSSGTSNANFSTPADGGRGKMQMYIFPNPTPDRDGDLDADVVVHELTHGLSNRLHGNGSGLATYMSGGLGEGWSDFYANSLLSDPNDSAGGIYPAGTYVTYKYTSTFSSNYYYGIRRFPYAVLSAVGGPNNRPFNPMTFADIDSTKVNLTDGAFARNPVFGSSATTDEVHNTGEVWCAILWEARGRLVARLGGAEGNRRMLQFVTDGMKLSPTSPTFTQARDAIIAAAQASGAAADVADLWSGFAARGLGYSAKITNPGAAGNSIRVTEAFDLPNLLQTPNLTVSDAVGNNNGYAEPGEKVTLSIALNNNTGNTATGTTLQIVGGVSTDYGNIANNSTVTKQIAYTIPANTPCGIELILTLNVNSSLGATAFTRGIIVGVPNTTFSENFDAVTAPALPSGWTTAQTSAGVVFKTYSASSDTAPNSVFTPDLTATGGEASLTSPPIAITAPAATVSFRHSFNTEAGWDGGVLEISVAGGAFTDILAAGGKFLQGEYTSVLGASTGSTLGDRPAWNGTSPGYITTVAQLPAAAAGQNVQLRWRFSADDNTVAPSGVSGWFVDTFKVNGSYSCGSMTLPPTVRSRADFDGDGKTDASVYRASNGVWYANGSRDGFIATAWGISTDKPVPGDYDNDGKTDPAVYRDGTWYIFKSGTSALQAYSWGNATDTPVQGDYDGDGKTEPAVYRSSNNTWYLLNTTTGSFQSVSFGAGGDKPVQGDYDGDGKTDVAVYRPSTGAWYVLGSTRGFFAASFGNSTDIPVPADYDGDNKDDIAVSRPSSGSWYILQSSDNQVRVVSLGNMTDIPVPGDYDGDGKDDPAVYRGGTWYSINSTTGFNVISFGDSNDTPIPAKYLP